MAESKDVIAEQLSYITAKLLAQDGCPRCGCKRQHSNECPLRKIVDSFETKVRMFSDSAFLLWRR